MRAVVPPTVSNLAETPSFAEALEEMTAGKVLLILLGVGALGGFAYYLATKPKALAAATAPPTGVTATLRPTPPGNTFSPTPAVQVPPGVNVTVVAGKEDTLSVSPGDNITLTLPTGATWKQVVIGKSDNSSYAPVALGSDLSSPVSIALSTLTGLGYNAIAAQWADASGTTQAAIFAVVVQQAPLTFHH